MEARKPKGYMVFYIFQTFKVFFMTGFSANEIVTPIEVGGALDSREKLTRSPSPKGLSPLEAQLWVCHGFECSHFLDFPAPLGDACQLAGETP
jgi:hypothetical protein